MAEPARLVVRTGASALPVLVRDRRLRVVHSGLGNAELAVAPGLYVVGVTLPGDRYVEEMVDARAGHAHWLDLAPDDHERPALSRAAPSPPDPVSLVSGGGGELPSGWRVSLRRVEPPVELIDAARPIAVRSTEALDRGHQVELELPGDRAYFAEVSIADTTRTVALPGLRRCVLTGHERDVAAYPSDRFTQLAAQYLAFEDCAAGALLFPANWKAEALNPLAAAVAGYLFLRLGELDRLVDWPERLAARFPWLPDGLVILGERAALDGDHRAAAGHFVAAAARGIPVFTEGFSMLVSRSRQYENHLAGVYGRLAPHVDFGAPTTTIVSPRPAPGSARR